MQTIIVDVAIYGTLARHAGGQFVAQVKVTMEEGACVEDLLVHFNISKDEKGYLFINAILSDAPGLNASLDEPLHDGDHVGIFSTTHMWPYQYRDGVKMSSRLAEAMRASGVIHNVYKPSQNNT